MTRDRWQALMGRLAWPANDASFAALSNAYREPHRHYHTHAHIADCLAQLDAMRDTCAQPDAIELALWFHDAIYDPYRSDNEQASAGWAVRFLRDNGAIATLQQRVQALILATRHDAVASDPDMAILIDIDLSILGAAAETYERYRHAIRREYRWVPGPLFRRNRRAVLDSFRQRERIFLSDRLHASHEANARANIAAELEQLR